VPITLQSLLNLFDFFAAIFLARMKGCCALVCVTAAAVCQTSARSDIFGKHAASEGNVSLLAACSQLSIQHFFSLFAAELSSDF
jgi:hypothetical protein